MKICACLGPARRNSNPAAGGGGGRSGEPQPQHQRKNYGEICTTHTFDDRVNTIQAVQSAGMTTCSGGIFGLGESNDDIIDMALALRRLQVTSVPLNFLIPIEGTPFEGTPRAEPASVSADFVPLPTAAALPRNSHCRWQRSAAAAASDPGALCRQLNFCRRLPDYPRPAAQTDYAMIRDAGFVLEGPDGEAMELPEVISKVP
jgi:biotin synthase